MSKTFTKTSLRGFTLIELLVVIAIIGLLSTAIMGPVQTGLKKGRDTRKISDISQIQGALMQYAGDNTGTYPVWLAFDSDTAVCQACLGLGFAANTLSSTTPTYMKPDDKMLDGKSAARDRYAYVTYADAAGNIVGYHLGAALENQNASLQGDADCLTQVPSGGAAATAIAGTAVTAAWGKIDSSIQSVSYKSCTTIASGALHNSNVYNSGGGQIGYNDAAGTYTGSKTENVDFGGNGLKENANDVCTAKLDTCVFDVVPN